MRRVQAVRREVDLPSLQRKVAAKDIDVSTIVDAPAVIYEGDVPRIVLLHPEEDLSKLENALRTIKYGTGYRTVGLKSTSRVIGSQPRLTIRRDFCCESLCAKEHPAEHSEMVSKAALAARYFEQHAPEQFSKQSTLLKEKVLPEWHMPGGVYTSGIANKNNELRYHTDAGNFKGFWSAMFVFTRGIQGGKLILPQLDVGVSFRSGDLILFDGGSLLHGVTAIRSMIPNSYRYSLVFYGLQQMCHCLSVEEELQRIRTKKTEREHKRLAPKEPT